MTSTTAHTKVAIRLNFRGLGRSMMGGLRKLNPFGGGGPKPMKSLVEPPNPNAGRNLGRAAMGLGAVGGLGAAGYGGHKWLQGEGGQDFLYNQMWGDLTPEERSQRALDFMEMKAGGGPSGVMGHLAGAYASPELKKRLEQAATKHMASGRGIADIAGVGDMGTGKMLMQNWQQYLPILLGLGLGVGGIAKRSPMMGLLGLLAGGYGVKSIYDKGKALKEEAPKLLLMTRQGTPMEREAARKRLRQLYTATAPAMKLLQNLGMKKTADFSAMGHLMDHFNTSKMVDEIRKDKGVDSRTAAEMITAIHNAQRIDSQPKPIMSVGEFATGAAGTALGFTLGARLGSLMSMRPSLKNTVRRIGQGLFSGADKLGVI